MLVPVCVHVCARTQILLLEAYEQLEKDVAKEIDKALGRQAEDLKAAQRRTEFLTQVRSCMHFHVCVRVRACGCARACVRFYRHVLVRVPFSVGFAAHASPAPGWVWHVC